MNAPFRSLRLRLVLLSLVLVAAALALFGWRLSVMFEHHVERRIFRELDNHAGQLLTLLKRDARGRLVLSIPLNDPRFSRPYSGLYWQVNGPKGPLARSRSLWDYALKVDFDLPSRGPVHEYTLKGPEGRPLFAVVRAVWLDFGDGEKRYVITLAQDHRDISAAVADFRSDLFPALGMLLLFLLMATGLQVWLGLRPLDAIRRQVAQVRRGHREELDSGAISELSSLIDEINALLKSQRRDMARARARAADLAHGLKTPLAILAAQARKLSAAGLSTPAEEIDNQVRTLRRHVDHELARAKIHGLRGGVHPRTPLRAEVQAIVRALSGLRPEAPVQWRIDIPADMTVPMERGDLLELLGNLLENACKWAGKEVRLSARNEAGLRVLFIEDDGPGIPEERFTEVFHRGRRLDESVQGTGLGLAIVRDIVDSYGYDLKLYRAAAGGLGLRLVFARRAGG